jgi:DNA-binding MarR family transcriptional regulator
MSVFLRGAFQKFAGMSLEHDIRHSKFRNEWQKAMINLTFTHSWVNERFKRMLDAFDITPQQFNILRILRGAKEPISTFQIRERMLDKMSDTSRIVDRMVVKKLVLKKVCRHDKRRLDIGISAKGLKVLEEIDRLESNMDAIMQGLNDEDARALNDLLDKLRSMEPEWFRSVSHAQPTAA